MTATVRARVLSPAAWLALLAWAGCFLGVGRTLWEQWSTNYLYAYGFIVPMVSLWFVRRRAHLLAPLPAQADWLTGVPVLLLALVAAMGGTVIGSRAIEAFAMVGALVGLVLTVLGRRACRLLAFPIAYLLVAIPVWTAPVSGLQVPSQILSGRIATLLLHLLGIPAHQDGTVITLPKQALDVLRECSGVNQLVAVVAMTLPAAVLFLRSWWSRTFFVLFATAVAYLSNGLRIALVGFLGQHDVNVSSDRLVHLGEGIIVSAVGYGLIALALSVLVKIDRRRAVAAPALVPTTTEEPRSPGVWAARLAPFAAPAVIVLVAGVGVLRASWTGGPKEPLSQELSTFPTEVGEWVAEIPSESQAPLADVPLRQSTLGALRTAEHVPRPDTAVVMPPDHELFRIYRHRSGARIEIHVAYYENQRDGRELSADLSSARGLRHRMRLALRDRTVELDEIVQRAGNRERRGVYWYALGDRFVTDPLYAKGLTLWSALSRRRTNGAVVQVAWSGQPGHSPESPTVAFLTDFIPLLAKYLPG